MTLTLQICISAASLLLFALLAYALPRLGWRRAAPLAGPESLAWGACFAVLYYYGLPMWWWRYGVRHALKILLACICATAALNITLRFLGLFEPADFFESLFASMLLAIPVRVAAGHWLARNDLRWRTCIVAKRLGRTVQG